MRPIEEIRHNRKLMFLREPAPGTIAGYIDLSTGARASFVAGACESGISEHVSIQLFSKRLPTWQEMCEVKEAFWDDEEEVIQIHPRKSEYVNISDAMHLWRPVDEDWNRLMREGR